MEAEIVIVKIEKHPQEMLLFTTNISFLHFLGLMFLIMNSLLLAVSDNRNDATARITAE